MGAGDPPGQWMGSWPVSALPGGRQRGQVDRHLPDPSALPLPYRGPLPPFVCLGLKIWWVTFSSGTGPFIPASWDMAVLSDLLLNLRSPRALGRLPCRSKAVGACLPLEGTPAAQPGTRGPAFRSCLSPA